MKKLVKGKREAPVRISESEFISEGAMIKTGAPAKFTLWGDSTVGLSHG